MRKKKSTHVRLMERPVLFKAEMVRAILDGRKTQTRRVIKPQPNEYVTGGTFNWKGPLPFENMPLETILDACPYGVAGDRLWVRETWRPLPYKAKTPGKNAVIQLRADESEFEVKTPGVIKCREMHKWRPSIFMPRWASRVTLEITNVRVERLQEISEVDAVAEGVQTLPNSDWYPTWVQTFCHLWNTINPDNGWDKNPWVWVVEFKRIAP